MSDRIVPLKKKEKSYYKPKIKQDSYYEAKELVGRRGKFGNSLMESVSIRRPSLSYNEFPEILDSDGNSLDISTKDPAEYTFDAKISPIETERNPDGDMYYVHFRNEMNFLGINDEILRHGYVECFLSDKPDIFDICRAPLQRYLHLTEVWNKYSHDQNIRALESR